MDFLAKIITVLFFPILIVARGVHAVMDADPLKLKEDNDAASHWIPRDEVPSRASYFSEASELEGRSRRGIGRGVASLLAVFARPLAPPSTKPEGEKFKPAADREQGIPDEVYTLW